MASEATRRFAADGVLIAGGGRAILLQVANPVVAAGVHKHSDFAHRPLHRLHNTLTFVYAVVLGTLDEGRLVAGFVNRAHAPVAGATDASHQLWVAATLYETAVRVHRIVNGPLDDATADALYRDYSRLGTVLQVPPDAWPSDRAAFARYWTAAVESLTVTDEARSIAHDLFRPVTAPLWLRAALPLGALLTASLLPPTLRDAYGIAWSRARRRRARLAWGVIRSLARLTPRRLREWPARHYLKALRASQSERS